MSTRPVRILVVDDHQDTLDMWAFFLRARGYEVLTAADGLAAVATAERERPDLAILDLTLPGLSGVEAGRRIRQQAGDGTPRLIALTGHSAGGAVDEARVAGFDSVLVKPCEGAALVAEIERVLAAAPLKTSVSGTASARRPAGRPSG